MKRTSSQAGTAHATLQLMIRESSFSFLDANRSVRIEASLSIRATATGYSMSAGAVHNAYSALSVDGGGPAVVLVLARLIPCFN